MRARLISWSLRVADRLGLLRVEDEQAQHSIVDAVRIYVAVVAFYRTFEIVSSARYYFDPTSTVLGVTTSPSVLWGAAVLALLGCVAIGFATPLALVVLVLVYPQFDLVSSTSTLGTNLLSMAAIFLLLAGAGSTRSVDAWIIRGRGRVGRAWRWWYRPAGVIGVHELAVARMALLLAFWSVSLGAMIHHLADEYWRGGDTIRSLSTSSYLSTTWRSMRALDDAAPVVLTVFSAVSGVLQTAWELLMVPLALTRWGRRFVIFFGALFIAISLFELQLSYLPIVEVGVWTAIWLTGPIGRVRIPLLYDDRCNLCRRSVATLRFVDVTGELELSPVSRSGELMRSHDIDPTEALVDMHGIVGGRVRRGFDLYFAMAHRLPLLVPTLPLWYLARWTRLGPAAYGFVAARRLRIAGQCELSPPPAPAPARRTGFSVLAWCVIGTWLVLMPVQWYNNQRLRQHLSDRGFPIAAVQSPGLRTFLYRWGLDSPDVFNRVDLRMGDVWAVVDRRTARGEDDGDVAWTRLPYVGDQGERLEYLDSDVLYFGTDLVFRRSLAPTLDVFGRIDGLDDRQRLWLQRVATYDYRRRGLQNDFVYRARLYANDASDVERRGGQRYDRTLQLTYEVLVRDGVVLAGSDVIRPARRS